MEINPGEELRKKEKILAVCAAGVNRSGFMKDILLRRGYDVFNKGVINNFIEPEDLEGVDMIVFASPNERKIFESRPELVQRVESESIKIREINVTQSDLDKATREKKVGELKAEIEAQLEGIGLRDLNQAP
jgi:galactitol-specific phosphotransferase system IIB component